MGRRETLIAGALITVATGAGVVVARRRGTGTRREPRFDPDTVARIETEGWRAYYDRRFLDGFKLLVEFGRDEFGLGRIGALRAGYFAVRGQMAYAGARGDADAARRWMARYYALAPRRAEIDPAALADAEVEYWVVHRRLVRESDKTELVDALARLHALLFGGTPDAMRPSAEQRALACNAVDRITGRTSTNPCEDWRLVRAHLASAYRLALAAAQGSPAPPRDASITG